MILLTGGAGYIGSHIALALADAGRPFLVVDNLSTGRAEALLPGVPFVEAEVGDRAGMAGILQAHGVSAVIHCAGSISVEESVREPLLYYRNNVAASIALVEAMADAGVRPILFSSSASVYGPVDADLVDEGFQMNPVTPYAVSKAMVERILGDAEAAGVVTAGILRYFNVGGADPKGRAGQRNVGATNIIKIAVDAALGRRSHVAITGTDYATPDGTGVRDFIHVSDLADAHVLLLDHLAATGRGELMNVGYGTGTSVLEVLDMVDEVAGTRMERRKAPRRPGDIPRMIADASRIRRTLGWVPRYASIAEIITHTVAWERRHLAPDQPASFR